ncbi:MAG: DUF3306 domain-containing protein [Candidatus Methylophosphatis roskildensis]
MAEEESFLSRWARLKHEAAAEPASAVDAAAQPVPVELPSVDSLGFDSDFTGFLRAKVDEKLRQAALKKLFHSPQFNVMDGLDVYIDDYNTFEPIPSEMLRELNHARDLLFGDEDRSVDMTIPDGEAAARAMSDVPFEPAANAATNDPSATDDSAAPAPVTVAKSESSS